MQLACEMSWLLEWSYFEIHCVFLERILAQFRLSHHSTKRFFSETGSLLMGFVVFKNLLKTCSTLILI